MRWKKVTNFVLAVFFTIAYVIVTIFTLIGTSHPPSIAAPNTPARAFTLHPFLSFVYLILALIITWGVYAYFKEKASFASFIVAMLMGIGMISIGILFWVTATY